MSAAVVAAGEQSSCYVNCTLSMFWAAPCLREIVRSTLSSSFVLVLCHGGTDLSACSAGAWCVPIQEPGSTGWS